MTATRLKEMVIRNDRKRPDALLDGLRKSATPEDK